MCIMFAEPIKKSHLDSYHLKEDNDYVSNKNIILPFFVGKQELIFISILSMCVNMSEHALHIKTIFI